MDKWNIWYHYDKDNWKLSGYKKIYEINDISSFWKLYNNWHKLDGILNKHLFLMRHNITPIWEDPININGGCWSYKINDELALDLWEDLSTYLICEQISPIISSEILGISISSKKNNNVVIKIWNQNSKNNSLKILNDAILKKWGTDVIYIAHMPENQ